MKKFVKSIIIMGALLYVTSASAIVPELIPIQGILNNVETGESLNGSYDVTFAIYNTETGKDAIWTEVYDSNTEQLTVDKGFFTAYLGQFVDIDFSLLINEATLFLGITIEDDDELSPRIELASVPFAMEAQYCKTLDGFKADYFLPADDFSGHTHPGTDITSAVANASNAVNCEQLQGNNAAAFALSGHSHKHSELTALDADDHPQYFALNQNENVTGDISFAGETTFNLQPSFNGGDSSHPPFSVDSSVLVNNLNADRLDGLHASSFVRTTANTVIQISHIDVVEVSSNINTSHSVARTRFINMNSVSSYSYIYFPVSVPSSLLGITQEVKSLEICYKSTPNGGTGYITTAFVDISDKVGTTSRLMDITNLNSTSYTCRTTSFPGTASNIRRVDGSVTVRLYLYFPAGSQNAYIDISSMALAIGPA